MTIPDQHKHLIAWPAKAEDMNVDLMLRIIGADTQVIWLEKMAAMDAGERPSGALYMARTQALIGAVGLMSAIRALRDIDPAKAEAFVRDYWLMCEDGGVFGELLWDWTQAAGLDPALIAPPSVSPAAEER